VHQHLFIILSHIPYLYMALEGSSLSGGYCYVHATSAVFERFSVRNSVYLFRIQFVLCLLLLICELNANFGAIPTIRFHVRLLFASLLINSSSLFVQFINRYSCEFDANSVRSCTCSQLCIMFAYFVSYSLSSYLYISHTLHILLFFV
jgi:hypothetical protein